MSRIIQMLYAFSYGDAIANHTQAIYKKLKEKGRECLIYAEIIDERLKKMACQVEEYIPREDDIIVYHLSTGCELNKKVLELPGKIIINYHNITPPAFFHTYSKKAESNSINGIEETRMLRKRADYAITVSDYNANELKKLGYQCPIETIPIILDYSDYEKEPDKEIIQQFSNDKNVNILFVGRIAPNKKQEDIIRDFYCYSKAYNTKSRLILVGNYNNFEGYYLKLKKYIRKLGLKNVVFPGHISFREILAYYSIADVFVCESEHEGFCVPLIEAMHFKKPIIAFDCSAVGETLGNAGILMKKKDPNKTAEMINRLVTNPQLKADLQAKEAERLTYFKSPIHLEKMIEIIDSLL